ncbi:Bug family tripartite tricarboxylate transporter substrate binding protein [Humitalea sp. 24SJ18S-53]|uniref:Bug family tripartite tricarboxylate transporter substrate binding protein n=1 Tax=Humitalea sp. 24SJ18S-53 TaxID=3422307 RepID=UPI003D6648A3
MDRFTLPSRRGVLAAALAVPALSQMASAQPAWPTRPVRIVVPFAAGGATDGSARIVAQKLSEVLGQPVVVENRPGAGGTTGADFVAKAAPDGYTFVMASVSNLVLAQGLYSRLPYDPVKDFIPVAPVVMAPIGIAVQSSLGVTTLQEFIALLKANPGRYQYGSAGNGASGHISSVAFLQLTGTQALHVPYRGSGPVFNDLLAGVVHFTADVPGLIKPHHDAGTIRALVMATPERSTALPDVPTSAEAGLPAYRAYSWFGLFAPANTPMQIVDRMAAAVETAVTDPTVSLRLDRDLGLPPMPGYTPARFAEFLQEEIRYWLPIVQASGARLD